MAEEAILSDSGTADGTTAAESADETAFDLGGDLDEDLSSPERPALAAPETASRTTEPEPHAPLDLNTTEIEKLPAELQQMARELKGDHTRKTQAVAELVRQSQARDQSVTTREQALLDRLQSGDKSEDDPFAALRSSLTEEEARGLDIVDQVVAAKHGKIVEEMGERLNQQQGLLQKLALAVIQQASTGANAAAATARQQYPDIDQYKDQVNALTAVRNPATGQAYTPVQAYELVTGRAQARSVDLATSDLDTRLSSARATTATSTAAADSGTGELNSNELSQGLKSLGFE